MTTHQAIGGMTDQQLLDRMRSTHEDRYNDVFWAFFDEKVLPALPNHPVIVDLGCGPGLLLRDLAFRLPGAELHGCDATISMIEHAQSLDYGDAKASFDVRDLAKEPVPLADSTVSLVTMGAVLHVLEDPFAMLAEIRRVLAPGGLLVVQDWVRMPMREYLNRRGPWRERPPEEQRSTLRLFPVHNKYTAGDWRWLFRDAGFRVLGVASPRPHFRAWAARPSTR